MQPEAKIETSQNGLIIQSLQRTGVYVAQILSYPLLLSIRLLIVRRDLHRNISKLDFSKDDKSSTYILFSNHQSVLDPFIICASLPYKTIAQLIPFRFFVANPYFKGLAKPFLNVMGGFRAYPEGNKPYGIDKARSLIATNQTIVIFPPGTRTRKRIVKPGVSILATEPNTYLIPAHIEWKNRWSCSVHIGNAIEGGKTYQPEKLMDLVYALPKKV